VQCTHRDFNSDFNNDFNDKRHFRRRAEGAPGGKIWLSLGGWLAATGLALPIDRCG
jgi:hypothetical protein